MPGPWDKYGGTATAEPDTSGPWQKYAAAPPSTVTPIDRKPRHALSMTGRSAREPKRSVAEQVLDLAEGTGKVAAVGGLPAGMVLAPEATLLGMGGAAIGGYGGEKLAKVAGAGPTAQRAARDVGAAAGGYAGAEYGPAAAREIRGVVREVAPRAGRAAAAVAERLPGGKWSKETYAAARRAYKGPEAPQPPSPPPGPPQGHVDITGDTYPVRAELRALGAKWDKERQVWTIPKELAQRAQDIVAGVKPVIRPPAGYRERGARE